jgi:hypothetical protein
MKLLIFLRDLAVRMKTRLFFPYIVFATFLRKLGFLISDLYFYSIKIQININKKISRKIRDKTTNFLTGF